LLEGQGDYVEFTLSDPANALTVRYAVPDGPEGNTLPTLILHGDADRILPADATSRRQAKMIKNVRFVELKGGPHGLLWTHAEEVNSELVKFLA
jgi:pimeloyl-ACP methyl ester carboxylesterase